MATKVGFIGLGAMGLGMSKHLIAAGFQVTGHDSDAKAVEAFAELGGRVAANAADAAKGADILLICVFNRDDVESVLFSEGALAQLASDATIVMHTTMEPEATQAVAERARARGLHYLDVPITGGKKGADDGTLTCIVSGSDEAYARARPALDAMSARTFRVGLEPGAASTVKMVNQLLVGINLMATAEAVSFAAKAGADPQAVYDIITHGAGNSHMFEGRAPDMIRGETTPAGVLDIFIKDLGIVLKTGASLDFPLPLTQQAMTQYENAVTRHGGRAPDTTIVKVYEANGEIDVAAATRRFRNTD